MTEAIGSLIANIPTSALLLLVFSSTLLLVVLNTGNFLQNSFNSIIQAIRLSADSLIKGKKVENRALSSRESEDLATSLVGKFIVEDFTDGNEILAKKGTLISEQIVREAQKRDLLKKLGDKAVFWPVES